MALESLGLAPGALPPYGCRSAGAYGAAGDAGLRPQQKRDEQWVDGPSSLSRSLEVPQPRPDQDMIYQWVDTPSVGRMPLQQPPQPYMHPAHAPPYYPLEPSPYGHGIPPRADQYLPPPQAGHGYGCGGYQPPYQQASYPQRRDHSGGGWGNEDGKAGGRQQRGGGKGAGGVDRYRGQKGSHSVTNGGTSGGRVQKSDNSTMELQAAVDKLGKEGLRELLSKSLESLYEDRIKPMGNYVKGRLKERLCPEPIVKNFVDSYSQHLDLFTVQNTGEEPTILFTEAHEPAWFKGWVDIDSPDDPYDESMWESFTKYLDGDQTFPGGRYGMARELVQKKLPFLADFSLGQVCHIVQLAIQHRKIIVYHRKVLKPIQAVIGRQPAENGTNDGLDGEEIKDMDELCLILFRVLKQNPQGVLLCRMKHMIKREYGKTLSEMTFRCTKLIELFNQEPLSSAFVLNGDNNAKCLYVCRGDPETFPANVKAIYAKAN